MTKHVNIKSRSDLLEMLVKPVLVYSCQAWDLPQDKKTKLENIYRNFQRKMIIRTWKKTKLDENGDHRPIITNDRISQLTKTTPLQNYINKQFLKYQGHITRRPNKNLQKQLQFIIRDPNPANPENVWSKCSKLMGGMDEIQLRKLMQNREKYYSALDDRFGKRRSKRSAQGQISQQVPELCS